MRHVVLYAVLKVAYLISASGHVLLMSLHVLIEFIVSESWSVSSLLWDWNNTLHWQNNYSHLIFDHFVAENIDIWRQNF